MCKNSFPRDLNILKADRNISDGLPGGDSTVMSIERKVSIGGTQAAKGIDKPDVVPCLYLDITDSISRSFLMTSLILHTVCSCTIN